MGGKDSGLEKSSKGFYKLSIWMEKDLPSVEMEEVM